MISEVSISLTGDKIPVFIPVGASVHYGINRLPYATVELDPSATPLLCNFDAIRRSPVTLNIETTNGCLYFDGVIDGLSFSQAAGSLTASLIIKHRFVYLQEIYPRIAGIHPGSTNIFRTQSQVKTDWNGTNAADILLRMTQFGVNINTNQTPVDFAVQYLRAAVELQKIIPIVADDGRTIGLHRVIKESEVYRKGLSDAAITLLEQIDTTATKRMQFTAASKGMVDWTLENISMLRDNIFDNLVRILSELGCCLVIGSRKAYVVPEATYLRIPKLGAPVNQQRSTLPNVIYPAEYNNLVFNDNGYVNIRGVYVMHDASTSFSTGPSGNFIDLGFYVDESTSGNIYTTTLPKFISHGIMSAAAVNGTIQNKLKGQKGVSTGKVTKDRAKNFIELTYQKAMDTTERTKFMNQWAQMEYCRLKYDDRTGHITSSFNNNWAPGCVGTLYTRAPGTWLDYFVTDVHHSFALNPPNGGSATTNIGFKGGRMGTTSNVGLDRLALYDYAHEDALAFGNKFLDDIST